VAGGRRSLQRRKREEFAVVLLFTTMGWVGEEGWVALIHGGAEVVWLRSRWRERRQTREKNWGGRLVFFANFEPNFLDAQAMKSTP
jgi:hypothetical protein